jgi:hypothetical protein
MPTKGTPKQTIRVDPDLWQRFGEVVGDRAANLRAYMEWMIRLPGAKMPKRPGIPQTAEGDHGGSPTDSGA